MVKDMLERNDSHSAQTLFRARMPSLHGETVTSIMNEAGLPYQLLGISPEQSALINDHIEAAHVPSSYQTRDSARKVSAMLVEARDSFGTVQFARVKKLSNADDVVLARAIAS